MRRVHFLYTIVSVALLAMIFFATDKMNNSCRFTSELKESVTKKENEEIKPDNVILGKLQKVFEFSQHGKEEIIQSKNNRYKHIEIEAVMPVSGTVYYYGKREKKQLALTFDDGPDEFYTNKILEILNRYHIEATFFVIGKNAEMHPDVVKRIENEGHIIGNHTYSHLDLNNLNDKQIAAELSKTQAILDSILGHHVNIMRPPYGDNSQRTVKIIASLGYNVVDWSVDTRDWAGTSTAKIMEYVKGEVGPGAIILHHCANKVNNTLEVLPKEIEWLKGQGYDFVTIPTLIGVN